ncbi:ACR141Wp [Eremothecium gossypii ATCC 10895]|uniref:ACR141Wp n=1 Tax=Eremothecium gossypii (strain ATCC 10895 / CBS 109.51 / FGSC 9923 / NRRL Y-1056) TaxID=284811 RepID=Q75BX9_EREGS|nr:ACR141Wp [Eremothecium gossypii ATCC 10895]AAS51367.2 ACR141Wp [Eremothecium gossypii ATCC 10895]
MLLGRIRSKTVLKKCAYRWIRPRSLLLFVLGVALYHGAVWYLGGESTPAGDFIRLRVPSKGRAGGGAPVLREEEWLSLNDKDRWRANYDVLVRYLAGERARGQLHPVVLFAWADWAPTRCPRRRPRCGEFAGGEWGAKTGPVVERVVLVAEGRNLETQAAQEAAADSGVFGRGRMAAGAGQIGEGQAEQVLADTGEVVARGRRVRALRLPRLEQRVARAYRGANEQTVELEAADFALASAAARRAAAAEAVNAAHPAYRAYVERLAAEHAGAARARRGKKYFSELIQLRPGGRRGQVDARFGKAGRGPPAHETAPQMRRLMRCWERFARNEQLLYWLAHGTLLGWYWQGTALEWDSDHDVQLPMRQLEHLALHFNASLLLFEDGGEVGRYYLDINDHYRLAEKDPDNIIDGRLIDVDTGMYIDLTGIRAEGGKYTDGAHHVFHTLAYLDPLRITLFDGLEAPIPHAVTSVLMSEYESGLFMDTFQGYHFDHEVRGWVSSACDECFDRDLALEWRAHTDARAAFCERHGSPLYTECCGLLQIIPPEPAEGHIAKLSAYFKEKGY